MLRLFFFKKKLKKAPSGHFPEAFCGIHRGRLRNFSEEKDAEQWAVIRE